MNKKIGCVQHDCDECAKRETFVSDVRRFTESVGCTTSHFNVRQTALYIGLMVEEMAEVLEATLQADTLVTNALHSLSLSFKEGSLDHRVANSDMVGLLDGCVDLAWVTVGSMLSQGADVHGAMREVARSNMSKLIEAEDGTLLAVKDGNGKVTKPDNFSPADVSPFVCKAG